MSNIKSKMFNDWYEISRANVPFKARALRNLCHYAPLSPYDFNKPEVVEFLKESSIETHMLHYINLFVQSWSGLLAQHKVSPVWTDRENDDIDPSEVIQGLRVAFDSDRSMYKYDREINDFIVNAMIFMGVMEPMIDKTPLNPMGRIKFKSHPIGSVWFEPDLSGYDIGRESRKAIKEYHLSIDDAIYYFPERKDELLHHQQQLLYENDSDRHELANAEYNKGSKYSFVELYYIEKSRKGNMYTNTGIKLPDSPHDLGSQDDLLFKQEFMKKQGIKNVDLKVHYEKIEVAKVYTFSPTLGLEIQDKVDQRQIYDNGRIRLPFYTFSYETIHGKPIGLPDVIFKCQKDINDYENRKGKLFKDTPWAGQTFVHPLIHGNDEAIKENMLSTDPSKLKFMHEQAPPGVDLIKHLPAPTLNPQMLGDQSYKKEEMFQIARISQAAMGQYGKSHESSLLHDRKVSETNAINGITISDFQSISGDLYSAWLQMSLITYKGNNEDEFLGNMNRKFRTPQGKRVVLNQFDGLGTNGEPIIKNDLRKVRFDSIITSLDFNNNTEKARNREVNYTMMTGIPESEYNQAFKILLQKNIVSTMDNLKPEEREKMEEFLQIALNLANNRLVTATRASELEQANIEAQFQQLQIMSSDPSLAMGADMQPQQQGPGSGSGQQQRVKQAPPIGG